MHRYCTEYILWINTVRYIVNIMDSNTGCIPYSTGTCCAQSYSRNVWLSLQLTGLGCTALYCIHCSWNMGDFHSPSIGASNRCGVTLQAVSWPLRAEGSSSNASMPPFWTREWRRTCTEQNSPHCYYRTDIQLCTVQFCCVLPRDMFVAPRLNWWMHTAVMSYTVE